MAPRLRRVRVKQYFHSGSARDEDAVKHLLCRILLHQEPFMMFFSRNRTSSVPLCHCLGWTAFTVTHQTTRSSPQLLFPPFLTYNLTALYLYSLIHLPPAPPPHRHSILHPVTPLFLQPLSPSSHSLLCLSFSACHSLLYAPRPPPHFPPRPRCCSWSRLASPRLASHPFQVCCIATVCTSITLFALPFKLCFPFRQIAVFTIHISPFQPPPPGPFFPILLFFLFPEANIS